MHNAITRLAKLRRYGAVFAAALAALGTYPATQTQAAQSIATSKHNLSVTGPGTVKAATES